MGGLLDFLQENFEQFDAAAAIDVFIIWLAIFWILLLLRNTTAMTVIRGATILLIAAFVLVRIFDLRTLDFLLRNSFLGVLIVLAVVFQHEIRRALERVGRAASRTLGNPAQYDQTIETVGDAATSMARRRIGALIVLERDTGCRSTPRRA
jgi:diadenylate cyclase